jgi:D-alanine-D-alanine ligase
LGVRVGIVYNKPVACRYDAVGEEKAVLGVLSAVRAVRSSLLGLGYDTIEVPLEPPLEQATEKLRTIKVDLVYNLFEGFCGQPETEACVPEVLSELGVPYTGCKSSVLRLALDKAKAKALIEANGIDTPGYQLLGPEDTSMFQLKYPCIVKPRGEDASHGISPESVVSDFTALEEQVGIISSRYGGKALVEEFIDGREFNATALGNSGCTVLPVSEIDYRLPSGMPRLLTFASKWEPGSIYYEGTKVVCPAMIEAQQQEEILNTVAAVFQLLGCRGYVRVDMRLNKVNRLNVLEVNPNPDISPDSGAARQAEAAGMSYSCFIEKIVQNALEIHPQ